MGRKKCNKMEGKCLGWEKRGREISWLGGTGRGKYPNVEKGREGKEVS